MFKNRVDAGKRLAQVVEVSQGNQSVVLALPRGGLPLAVEVARYHEATLDVILAKKIGHPLNPEYAIGAVAEGGQPMLKAAEVGPLDRHWLAKRIEAIRAQMGQRRLRYDEIVAGKQLTGQDVIIVDDGIATGQTMFAAIEAVKVAKPGRLAVAVPVIAGDTYRALIEAVDDVYAVHVTERFRGSVGAYYESFPQVSDQEVEALLKEFASRP